MDSIPSSPAIPAWALWTGRALRGLLVLFFLWDGALKFVKPDFVIEGMQKYGYPETCLLPLGVVLVVSTLLYAIPRTKVLGAILLTGYLGGAVATHVRADDPFIGTSLVPVYFGIAVWFALWLEDAALRRIVPLRA